KQDRVPITLLDLQILLQHRRDFDLLCHVHATAERFSSRRRSVLARFTWPLSSRTKVPIPRDSTNCRSIAPRIFFRSLVIMKSFSPSVRYFNDPEGAPAPTVYSRKNRKQRRTFCRLNP